LPNWRGIASQAAHRFKSSRIKAKASQDSQNRPFSYNPAEQVSAVSFKKYRKIFLDDKLGDLV